MIKPTDKKNILISGIFVSLLLVVVVATVFMLNKENAIFRNDIVVIAEVTSAHNLKNGAAIQLRGIKVGSVKEIRIKDLETIEILMAIDADYTKWIKQDAVASFKTQGVLGDKFLEITGGTDEAQPIVDNGAFSIDESSKIDQIINKSEDLMSITVNLLTKFDKIFEAVEHDKLGRIANSLDKLTSNLAKSINPQELEAAIKNFNASSSALNNVAKQIEKGPGSMHSLIYDQGLHEDLRSVLGGANRSKLLKFFIRESIQKSEDERLKEK